MKMKCLNCGNVITINNLYCPKCGTVTNAKQREKQSRVIKNAVFIPLIALNIVLNTAFSMFCYKRYLLPWQLPLLKNRAAIVKYVKEKHPGSKIYEEHIQYNLATIIPIILFEPDCYINFEKNGFQYKVSAKFGRVSYDSHNYRKLESEVKQYIEENFLDRRGIKNVDIHCNFSYYEYDGHTFPDQWSEYDDYYNYKIRLNIRGQGTTPAEVGWIYDFY